MDLAPVYRADSRRRSLCANGSSGYPDSGREGFSAEMQKEEVIVWNLPPHGLSFLESAIQHITQKTPRLDTTT